MNWDVKLDMKWCNEIINYEQKKIAAKRVAAIAKNGDIIGFGSGSTSYLTALEIGERVKREGLNVLAIPTSSEITMACYDLGIPIVSLNNVRPDWYFDGADEVDKYHNLIKGRGGCMFMEKLIMKCSPKTYIAVDNTKFVEKLGTNFSIPIEINPNALIYVKKELNELGSSEISLRLAKAKDGPVITENANFILDVKFKEIYPKLENDIKLVTGVIESGLFLGYNIEVVTI